MRIRLIALLAGLASCQSQRHKVKMPIQDYRRPLVPMESYKVPDDLDGSPHFFYPREYRILNCWECFEAQGKVCTDKGNKWLERHTKQRDAGSAFCCKPGSTDRYCTTGVAQEYGGEEGSIEMTCSQPSMGATDAKYESILTDGRNHQMFAFCPAINQKICGITGNNPGSTDMALKAGVYKQKVRSSDMRFKKANMYDYSREYDACYYEIKMDKSILDTYVPRKLTVQISHKINMNIFIYGGSSRFDATESVIEGNQQAIMGGRYTIDPEKGFLIVAYPNEVVSVSGSSSDFGFNYWIDADLKGQEVREEDRMEPSFQETISADEPLKAQSITPVILKSGSQINFEEENSGSGGQQPKKQMKRSSIFPGIDNEWLFYGLCTAAGVILIVIVVICIQCGKKQQTQHDKKDQQLGNNQRNKAEISLQVEDLDEEDFDTNRPALGGNQGVVYSNTEQQQMSNKGPPYNKVHTGSVVSNKDVDIQFPNTR